MKITVLFRFFPLLFAGALSAAGEGETIYMKGLDHQGQPIATILNDLHSEVPLGCVNCHRESGFGTSESGQTIPPVSWKFLSKNQPETNTSRFYPIQNKRPAYTAESLHRVLTSGINSKGMQVDPLMPRYALTRKQSDRVLEHLNTLYNSDDAGVDGNVLRIATIIDSRLPRQETEQHVEFLRGLIKMKNGLTRGELRRKQHSPIQKVPQYESYRKWELVVWDLPENTSSWRTVLTDAYQKSPVFVVIRPLVQNNYAEVAGFCSNLQLPCLFPSGADNQNGDFYNFMFRNRIKQVQDYITRLKHSPNDRLLFVNEKGRILPLAQSMKDIPIAGSVDSAEFKQDYAKYCMGNSILLAKTGVAQAALLDSQVCPLPSAINIKLIADQSTDYQAIAKHLNNQPQSESCWVTDYGQVLKRNMRQIRVNALVRRFQINNPDYESLAKSLFVFGLVGDSLHQMAGNFSRTYMLELIEHMLNSTLNSTYFSSISGAPYQRYIVGPINEYCRQGSTI